MCMHWAVHDHSMQSSLTMRQDHHDQGEMVVPGDCSDDQGQQVVA